MASFVKFFDFVEQLGLGKHNLNTDQLNVYLTNATPDQTADTVKADLAEIATSAEYVADGADTGNTWSETGGTATLAAANDPSWTAGASGIGPARYVVLMNVTQTTPLKPLVGYWDYGVGGFTLADGESFTVTIGASLLTLS